MRGTAAVIGKRIRFRVTNSIIEVKRHLQEFLEDTAYEQEDVSRLLQKIAEKYSIRILN